MSAMIIVAYRARFAWLSDRCRAEGSLSLRSLADGSENIHRRSAWERRGDSRTSGRFREQW